MSYGNISNQAAYQNMPQQAYPQEKLANACTPASIIDVQIGHLDSRVDVLQKLAHLVEHKLAKVLRQVDSPPVNRAATTTACTGVILGDVLNAQTERLQDVINHLNNTLDRIEL